MDEQYKKEIEDKLTEKQKLFCDYYVETGNATQSAIRAGYSEKTAKQIGHENLTKIYLYDYIKMRNDELNHIRIADMAEVKRFWTDMLRDQNIEFKDRLKASEFISKTNGAFLDKIEHAGVIKTGNPLAELSTDEIREMLKKS